MMFMPSWVVEKIVGMDDNVERMKVLPELRMPHIPKREVFFIGGGR